MLIVEDDFSLQKLYEMILKNMGFEILGIANNGEEAINMYKSCSETPDLILMDHRMPIKDGIEASQEILSFNHHTKILFASADINIKEKAMSIGACGFLEKPFSIKKLQEIIQKILFIPKTQV